MWVVTGPFDSEVSNEVGFQKSKVLKSGKTYLLGRKSDCDIVVNHKKVSHEHGRLIVGGFTPDDVGNPKHTSTLTILNSKNKTMRIQREGDWVIVNPGATVELEHKDQIDIVIGLPLTVRWLSVCCFQTPGKVRAPVPIDGCASLGIHVARSLSQAVTHHLVPSYSLTPAHMTSLLCIAKLVKPEWLSELIELSILDPRESPRALEFNFVLPSENKFRPSFAAHLPPALKTFKTWEQNETRTDMFKGYRFVFFGEKGLEVPVGYRELVTQGGAEYETFTVRRGVSGRRSLKTQAWAKNTSEKVVLVADSEAMHLAVGIEDWEEIVSEAKQLNLEFIQAENILQAVANVDTFYVESASTNGQSNQEESPLPDVIPNTFSEEPSVPTTRPTPSRRARSSSQAQSEQPTSTAAPASGTSVSENKDAPLTRRLPPRRAMERKRATSVGVDDNTAIAGGSDAHNPLPTLTLVTSEAPPAPGQLPTPVSQKPVSQTRKLPPRRRAIMGIDPSLASTLTTTHPTPQTRPSQLDKYKDLFNASNPDRISQTQAETETQGMRVGMLTAVAEEEESQSQNHAQRGTKRRAGDEGVEVADATASAETGAEASTHRPKRRAVDSNAVAPAPAIPSSAQAKPASAAQTQTQAPKPVSGTKPTKPSSSKTSSNKLDTDENFLKAVNSTKRGKKHEDDFDREFNQLRITKPNTEAIAPAAPIVAPWDAIDDFGDVGVRGNFMVVVEMDVQRGSAKHPYVRASDETRPEWLGRQNFKKFKKKSAPSRTDTVELVVSEENDYGIGHAYWKSGASGSQSMSESRDITVAHPPPPRSKSKPPSKTQAKARGRSHAPTIASIEEDDDDDDDDLLAPTLSPAKPKPKPKAPARKTKATPAPKTRATTARAKTPARSKGKQPALFISDDDDEDAAAVVMELDEDDDGNASGTPGLASGSQADVITPDEDRDVGSTVTLRSSQGSESLRGAKRKADTRVEADDDSDDAVFKGFGGRKKGRVR